MLGECGVGMPHWQGRLQPLTGEGTAPLPAVVQQLFDFGLLEHIGFRVSADQISDDSLVSNADREGESELVCWVGSLSMSLMLADVHSQCHWFVCYPRHFACLAV